MKERDYALIVGERDHLLSEALGNAVPVVRCPGSSAVACPALESRSCAVRDNARATIVFVSNDTDGQRRVACLGVSEASVVAVIEGSTVAPLVTGDFAVVGAESGPIGILGAISGVIEASETDGR
jgi:hypothetical protein